MTKYPSHQAGDKVAVCLCVHADELEHRGLHCEALSRVSSSCSVKATRGERRQREEAVWRGWGWAGEVERGIRTPNQTHLLAQTRFDRHRHTLTRLFLCPDQQPHTARPGRCC